MAKGGKVVEAVLLAVVAALACVLAGCDAPGAVAFEEPVRVKVDGPLGSDARWDEEGEFGSHVIRDRTQLDSELEGMNCIVRSDGRYVPTADTAYYDVVLGCFDDTFFEGHALLDAHVEFGSGGQRFDVTGVRVRDGSCTVEVGTHPRGTTTHDMAYYCVLIPVERGDVDGVGKVEVECSKLPW